MIVPDRDKNVKSFRIPALFLKAGIFLIFSFWIMVAVLGYDYFNMVRQSYRNKHLYLENRQLKEQVQLFGRKINTLTEDIERIQIFEKKLRMITGIENADLTKPLSSEKDRNSTSMQTDHDKETDNKEEKTTTKTDTTILKNDKMNSLFEFEDAKSFINLKNLYEQKIATNFGMQRGYSFTKEWSTLTKKSFALAKQYAKIDYQFNLLKEFVNELEVDIHSLDQGLLDRDSFLKSTPTLLPTQGWITSYYGPRNSFYSGRIKMHEGMDIGAKEGRKILSPADGIVTFAGKKPGFGNFVQIDHGYGIETIYAHASRIDAIKGQKVKRGTTIARVGNTGYSTGPHLHYEVRVNGTPVDPLYFILD